jgi:hypothetical protein
MKRLLLSLVLVSACRSAATPPETSTTAAAQAAATPCAVPVPPNTGEWKQVQGSGITFCVPADWRVANQRANYSGGTVRWQYSLGRGTMTVTTTTTVASGGAAGRGPGSIANSGARGSAGTTMGRRVTTNEMIGGQMADIWFEEGNGRVGTGITFRDPPLSFTGEAAGSDNVALQLAVYRTIRFQR